MKQKSTYIRLNIGNYIRVILVTAIIYSIFNVTVSHAAEYYMGTGIVQGDLVYEHNNSNSPFNPNKFPFNPDDIDINSEGPQPIADNNLAVNLDGLIATLGYHHKNVTTGLNLEIGYYQLSGSYYNPTPGPGSSFFANIDYQNRYVVSRYHVPFARYFSAYAGAGLSSSLFSQSYDTVTYHYGKIKPFYNFGLRLRLKTVFIFIDYSKIIVEDNYLEAGQILSDNDGNQVPSATPFLDATSIKLETFTLGTSIYFGSGAR
ncbi:MAG: porin family protein [Alphaproteobacteria bacterium]|nr:porin family protein [Alphaproteobacteria bacterium]